LAIPSAHRTRVLSRESSNLARDNRNGCLLFVGESLSRSIRLHKQERLDSTRKLIVFPSKQVSSTPEHIEQITPKPRVFGISSRLFAQSLVVVFFISALTIRLDSVPPVWWDEGWTLSVARNWVEQGHYGRLLNGQPAPPGFEAAFPVTASIALSFRAFGVGLFQARFVSVLFLIGAITFLYYLARRLYNPSIAWATLASSVFIPASHDLHPIFMGRQVLGEVAAMFFLLASYISLLAVPRQPFLMTFFGSVFAALAMSIKAQVLPFWCLSLLIPLLLMLYTRKWKYAGQFGAILVGSLVALPLLTWLWRSVLQQSSFARGAIPGLYEVTAMVTSIPSRLFALIVLVLFGLPTLFGVCYSAFKSLTSKNSFDAHIDWVRLSLLVLVSTWLAWYLAASVGWTRYLFPASFLASIFVSAMLYDLTNGFDLPAVVKQFSLAKFFRIDRRRFASLFALLLVGVSVPRTLQMFYRLYVTDADASVQEAAQFLNTQTPIGSLVETYDSELFFLLDRPYHYPPDDLNIKLVRRTFLYQDATVIDYDPLAANPDYLVVGPHSKQWKLYEQVLAKGAFRLVHASARYDLY
jgi:hypothetical protein